MSPKGRPTDNKKGKPIHVRLDEKSEKILERYTEQEKVSRAEAIRRGISKLEKETKGGRTMIVTDTEFTTNFNKYIGMINSEDILISINGKIVAKVVNPQTSAVDSIRGILKGLPANLDSSSIRGERLSKYEDNV